MFVHALDTVRGRAHCIDLPHVGGGGGVQLDLSPDRSRLDVLVAGAELARVDTATFTISRPHPAATGAAVDRAAPAAAGYRGVAWLLGAAAVLAVAGLATLAARRRSATLSAWRPRSD
jgi:hypothetical protein